MEAMMNSMRRDSLATEIVCCYGFEHIEDWRWVGSEPRTAARLRADGREFVVRLYEADTESALITYHTEFVSRLELVGVEVESVIRTTSGDAYAFLSTGEAVILFAHYYEPPMPVPFGADDARVWGRFVARMHAACELWHPSVHVQAQLLRMNPDAILNQAMSFAAQLPQSIVILEEFGSEIISNCQHILGVEAFQPVHGDLWPGNMLKGPAGLRAIDFRESGDAPRAIDLATAFRWMSWRENPTTADSLWRTWIEGYCEICEPSELEISSVPAIASLQQLYWLIVEASEALEGVHGYGEASWYVEDHCCTIQALLHK